MEEPSLVIGDGNRELEVGIQKTGDGRPKLEVGIQKTDLGRKINFVVLCAFFVFFVVKKRRKLEGNSCGIFVYLKYGYGFTLFRVIDYRHLPFPFVPNIVIRYQVSHKMGNVNSADFSCIKNCTPCW